MIVYQRRKQKHGLLGKGKGGLWAMKIQQTAMIWKNGMIWPDLSSTLRSKNPEDAWIPNNSTAYVTQRSASDHKRDLCWPVGKRQQRKIARRLTPACSPNTHPNKFICIMYYFVVLADDFRYHHFFASGSSHFAARQKLMRMPFKAGAWFPCHVTCSFLWLVTVTTS